MLKNYDEEYADTRYQMDREAARLWREEQEKENT